METWCLESDTRSSALCRGRMIELCPNEVTWLLITVNLSDTECVFRYR